jgi:hypothetical protein
VNWLRRRWHWALALLLLWGSLGLHGVGATQFVRLRNALHFDALPPQAFQWTPATAPSDFLREHLPPVPGFAEAARGLKTGDDWQTALGIARHLLGSAPQLVGGGLRDDLQFSYRSIIERGEGYCADFVRVFEGLAIAAGLSVRRWSFSFDGYGGHGHQLVEVWNGQRWQLLDVYNNIYFVDAQEQPLGALELIERLGRGETVSSLPIEVRVRPGYPIPDKLQAYYRGGAAQWYLAWGSNPYTYDRLVEIMGPLRPLAQLGLMARGELPQPRALALPVNQVERERMRLIGWHLHAVLLGSLLIVVWLWPRRRRSRV